jgi:DnaJ-class molecular chaperone
MSLEQARTVLGVSSMDDWDTVKKASRSLLQQLHPDRIGDTPPAVQKAAEAEFNRVKEALAVIEPMLKPSSAAIS